MPRINLSGVRKSYGGGGANAVEDLDLEIADGEFMCLLGPSGCGKTTTLRMIAGLEHLSDGEIRVGSRVVDSVGEGVFVPPEKRQMGLVFQSYALWPHLTIERNTDFGLRLRNVPRAEREARVTSVMRTLGIEAYRDRYPSQLSGGQQQRVALARMLAVNPEVLLLDEPLSNLDAALRLEMRAELKRLHREFGTTIVFVTHDQWEAMTLATTIAVMSQGRLQQVGAPERDLRPAGEPLRGAVRRQPADQHDRPRRGDAARGGGAPLSRRGGRRRPGRSGSGRRRSGSAGRRRRFAGRGGGDRRAADRGQLDRRAGERGFEALPDDAPAARGAARASAVRFAVRPEALHVFDRDGNRSVAADAAFARARMN